MAGYVTASAQITDGVSATLITGDKTQVFYGFDAFKIALDSAAQTGSTIVLSPGSFSNPGNITKSISVYGAGFQPDTLTGLSETRVIDDIVINIPDADAPIPNGVHIEGIYGTDCIILNAYRGCDKTISGTEIVKCRFASFLNRIASASTLIRQSYFTECISGERCLTTDLLVANCYIRRPIDFANGSSALFDHCIMWDDYYSYGPYVYKGNIIACNGYSIQAGATLYYNVGRSGIFANGVNNVCVGNYDIAEWGSYAQLFADGQNDCGYTTPEGKTRSWVLAEPDKYVGPDGTPCGVTGGTFPWNPIPTLPRIIETSVDTKAEPGKLKVNIKAEARPLE